MCIETMFGRRYPHNPYNFERNTCILVSYSVTDSVSKQLDRVSSLTHSGGKHKGNNGACVFWGVVHLFSFFFARLWEPTDGRIKDFVCFLSLICNVPVTSANSVVSRLG